MAKRCEAEIHPVAAEFIDFLNASPTAFHAVAEAKRQLKQAGYEQISEREDWTLHPGGKYFFTRNHSTLVAFAIGHKYTAGNGFGIVGAHTDSPCLKLKPSSKVTKGGFLEIGVQPYGGGLWHTWFDRDLTIAGRVMVKRNVDGAVSYTHELVTIQEPILRIPNLAIHLDRGVNDGFKVDKQAHLVPVLATVIKAEVNRLAVANDKCTSESSGDVDVDVNQKSGQEKNIEGGESEGMQHHLLLLQLIASKIHCKPEEICDFELQLCDTQPSVIAGIAKEFIFSGRLDNLCMSFCALKALVDATASEESLQDETGVRMIALFDHEEVGSNSAQGAGSPVMFDALARITSSLSASDSKANITLEQIAGDSLSIVNWANSVSSINSIALSSWLAHTKLLLGNCPLTSIIHIFREHNAVADSLSWWGLDAVEGRIYYEIMEGSLHPSRGFWKLF